MYYAGTITSDDIVIVVIRIIDIIGIIHNICIIVSSETFIIFDILTSGDVCMFGAVVRIVIIDNVHVRGMLIIYCMCVVIHCDIIVIVVIELNVIVVLIGTICAIAIL